VYKEVVVESRGDHLVDQVELTVIGLSRVSRILVSRDLNIESPETTNPGKSQGLLFQTSISVFIILLQIFGY